jgi:hypothetical protein
MTTPAVPLGNEKEAALAASFHEVAGKPPPGSWFDQNGTNRVIQHRFQHAIPTELIQLGWNTVKRPFCRFFSRHLSRFSQTS